MDFGRIQARLDVLKGLNDLSIRTCSVEERRQIEASLSEFEKIGEKANLLKKELRSGQKGKVQSNHRNQEQLAEDLSFSLLAAIGEMSELSAAIRDDAVVDEISVDRIEREIADTFSYLLKIANRTGIDTRCAFLKNMLVNHWRFTSSSEQTGHYVTLVGMSGSGKTTLAGLLGTRLKDASVFQEDVTDNKHFPPSNNRDVAISQSWFLKKHWDAVAAASENVAIFEQSPTAIALGYCQAFADTGKLSREHLVRHLAAAVRIEEAISRKFSKRTMIFLKCDPEERKRRQNNVGEVKPEIFEPENVEGALQRRFNEICAGLSGRIDVELVNTTHEGPEESLERILDIIQV